MLAGQFTAPRTVQLLDHPEPQLPDAELQPGQIVFQPELTCLCGSDLPFFDGDFEGHTIVYPQPIGMSLHEMVGTIVATNGRKWQVGTRVLAVPTGQMGLMERFVMPEDQAIALRPGLSDELCLLAQPFGTVLHALKKLPNMIDRDVVVLGQGPIGQMFNATLRNLGARRIIGIDPDRCRLQVSHQMGATHVVCGFGRDVIAEIRNLLDGRLPEFVIEAVGHKAHALNDAIERSVTMERSCFWSATGNDQRGCITFGKVEKRPDHHQPAPGLCPHLSTGHAIAWGKPHQPCPTSDSSLSPPPDTAGFRHIPRSYWRSTESTCGISCTAPPTLTPPHKLPSSPCIWGHTIAYFGPASAQEFGDTPRRTWVMIAERPRPPQPD